ncbi:MAG TPA: tetratricopeptide repeat protein, partial [Pyrinomonadaceae bacterium]|nr:tetratricopeptide repeat protein [Pyrinomonadaceae bacterium]
MRRDGAIAIVSFRLVSVAGLLMLVLLPARALTSVQNPQPSNAQSPNSQSSGPLVPPSGTNQTAGPVKELRALKRKQSPLTGKLSGSEVQSYPVELGVDQFLSLKVVQEGVDVVLAFYGPDGAKLRTVDSPNGDQGEEWLSWIASVKGKYRFEVSSLEKTAKPGNYTLKDIEIRKATPRDRKYLTADLLFSEGDKFNDGSRTRTSQEALVKFEVALPIWREIGEQKWEAATLSRIAGIFSRRNEPARALEFYEQSLPLWQRLDDRVSEVYSLNNLARVRTALKQHERALELNRKALEVCRSVKQCDAEPSLLEEVAAGYGLIGEKEKAVASHKELQALYSKAGLRDKEADTLVRIATLHNELDHRQAAVDVFTQVLKLRQELKDRNGEANALTKLGHTYSWMGDQLKAIDFYQRALVIVQETGKPRDIAVSRFFIGIAYQRLGDQKRALELFVQDLANVTDADRILVLDNIARSHRLLGNRAAALDAYKQALALTPVRAGGPGLVKKSEAEVQIPDLEAEIKDQKEVETLEAEVLARRTAGDRPGEISALHSIGDLQLKLREPARALETFKQLFSLLQALGNTEAQAGVLTRIGLIHLALQNRPQTLDSLRQALNLYRETGDRRAEQDILSTVSAVRGSLRILPGSMQPERVYESEVMEAYKAVGDSKALTAFEASRQLDLWIASHHLEALKLQNSLLKEALAERLEKRPDISGRLKVLLGYFESFVNEENWPEAIKKGNEILALRPGLKYPDEVAGFYSNTFQKLGDVYFASNDHPRALEAYGQALEMRRALKTRAGEAETLVSIGVVHNWLGDRLKAIELYEQALALQRAGVAGNDEGRTLVRLGEAYFLMGDRQKALNFLNRAANSLPVKDDQTAFSIAELIGRVYASLGQRQKEEEYYKQSLSESQHSLATVLVGRKLKVGIWLAEGNSERNKDFVQWDKRREGVALADIGEAYYRLGMKTEALSTFNDALPILRTAGRRAREAMVLQKVGMLYRDKGDEAQALAALQQALALRRADGNRFREAEVLHTIGTVYDTAGDKQKALGFYSQALMLRREVKDPDGEGETLDKLMLLWKALDKSQLAVFYGKQAVNAFQRIRSNITGLDKDLQKSFLTSRADTYRQLADLLIANGRIPEAQQVLDALKQEEYLEFVRSEADSDPNTGATLTRNEAALLQRYREIESQVIAIARKSSELRGKETLTPGEKDLLARLEQDLEAANLAFDKFLARLPSEFSEAGQGAAKTLELRSAQGLSETLRELGAGVVALYTVTSAEKYHVILITSETQVAREYSIKVTDLNRKV